MPSVVPATKLPKQTSTTTSNSGGDPTSVADKSDAAPIILAIENKIRNLEKRKTKLLKIEEDVKKGKEVTKDQKEAVSHIGEVEQQLEAMKELLKTANEGLKQQLKLKKQERKAEQKERVQSEIGRLRELLKIQDVLSTLGHDDVRSDFKEGLKGAEKLSEYEIEKLDELFRKICPSHEDLTEDQNWGEYLQDSSLIAYSLLTNSSNAVPFYEGKNYRDLRTMVDKIIGCAYFASKFGRAQSPEQAKSEAASTISNADENARVVGEKTEEHQNVGQASALQMGVSSFNGGNGTTGVMAPLASSVSPPRQCSPSTLLGQGGQPNISFLQDDQSGGGAYGSNTAGFDASAINPSMPYSSESVAFANPAMGAYNAVTAPAVIFSQQPNLPAGYGLQFDSTMAMTGPAGNEHVMNPNAPTFVSHTDTSVYASTLVSAPQMHQEPTVAQYYVQQPAEDQRMALQEHHVDENHDDGTNDGFVQQGDRNAQNNQGYYRRGGGFRSGERGGGAYAGRGGGFRGGYRGGRQNEGGQGNWQGQGGQGGYEGGQGYRGRGGGGYRGGYRNDESGGGYQGRGGGRGGGGGYRGNRGGGQGGYEGRGGRGGGGGGYQRGGRGGGETGQE